jgi:hypothetical protein
MVAVRAAVQSGGMTSNEDARPKAIAALVVLAAFTVFSLWVVAGHGYFGFLSLARDEPWGLQMLLDLVIACSFGIGWMRADARRHGIATWPYVVATIALGSIGLLAYVVRRGFGR